MRKGAFLPVVLLWGALVWCARDKSPLGPVEGPAVCPQHDIPWPSLANSPWPMFMHDPQLSGRSSYVGPRKGKVKWVFKPGGTVYSAIVIAPDGTIYFPFCNGGPGNRSGLYALAPTGQVRWKLLLDLDNEVQPLVAADGTIFLVGYLGNKHVLMAVGPDGVLRGCFDLPCKLSTLLNIGVDGTLYSAMGEDLCAFTQTGQLLWKVRPQPPATRFSFQAVGIAPDGGTLYVLEERWDITLTALRAVGADGSERWSYPLPGRLTSYFCAVDSYGNISFATEEFPPSESCGLYCLSPAGELRWHYPVYASGIFLIDHMGNYYAEVGFRAVQISLDCEGRLRWSRAFEPRLSPFVCDREGVVYSCSRDGVDAFNSAGELLWHVPYGIKASTTRVSCPAIGADGTLYVGTYSNYPYAESVVMAIE